MTHMQSGEGMPVIHLATVSGRRMDRHGIVYESTTVHYVEDGPMDARGPFMVAKPHALHVIQVWVNVRRPYLAWDVEPSLRADGYRWIDPRGYPTNDLSSAMLMPRMPDRVLVPSARLPIGPTLTTGSTIMIKYPCGDAWEFEIKVNRWLDVPRLAVTHTGDHPIGGHLEV